MNHLKRAFDSQNQWWKFLLVFIISFIAGQLLGGIPLMAVFIFNGVKNGGTVKQPENTMDFSAYGIDPNFGLALMVLPFIAMLAIGALLIRWFHKRTLKDVINGGQNIRWERLISGFVLWAGIAAIYLIVDYRLNPDNFDVRLNLSKLIPLVIVAIVFIPFQAGTEEYFFRGYLAQGVAGWTKHPLLAIAIPSVLFGLMHAFNPEVKEYGFWLTMPQYILFGVFFGLVSVLDDGIEMAIGAHAGNNIFSAIFVTNKASALQTPALLLQHEVFPLKDLIFLFLVSILFVLLMSKRYKWNFQTLFTKIKPEKEQSFM